MSDRRNIRRNTENYEIVHTIIVGQIMRIIQTLMNERNALKIEVDNVRVDMANAEKKCADADAEIELLREQLADVERAEAASTNHTR